MKSFIRKLLLTACGALLAPALAVAAPWPPAPGDLVLGVQAIGSTDNVFFNLGPAHLIRDNAVSDGVLVNLNDALSAAFGNDWATNPNVYFGVFANFTNSPPTGSGLLGSVPDTNGDPGRTIYASKGAGNPQTTTAWTGFSVPSLGTAATYHSGQINALGAITANSSGVATLSQSANPVQWNNGWTAWNPVPGAAFGVFAGGIQRQFAAGDPVTSQTKMLDVYRVDGLAGTGTYETTIYLADNGDLSHGDNFVALTGSVPGGNGSITGLDEIYPTGSTIEITAVPDAGFGFTGWGGDAAAAGTDNPASLLMNAPKNVTATFAQLPSVITPTATDITNNSATLGANVDSDGGEDVDARGVVHAEYSVNNDPEIGGMGVTNTPAATNTVGTFTVAIAGLTEGTTYAYKAYVTTSAATVYTDLAIFTTDTNVAFTDGLGSVSGREILAGGNQRFRFNLAETRLLQVSATNAIGLQGRLLDQNGNVLATGNGNFLISRGLTAGNYVLEMIGGATPATFSLGFDGTQVATAQPRVTASPGAIISRNARVVRGGAQVSNLGNLPAALTVAASRQNGFFKVVYTGPEGNLTASLGAGTYTTPVLTSASAPVAIRSTITPNKKRLIKKQKGKKARVLKKSYAGFYRATALAGGQSRAVYRVNVR